MEEKTVHIPNISCGHCTMTIEREIGEINGVLLVKGNTETKNVTVTWGSPAKWDIIEQTLGELGYAPER